LTHWFSDFQRDRQIFFLNKKNGLQGHVQKWPNPKARLLTIPLKKTTDKLLEISYGKILGYICSEEALKFRNSKIQKNHGRDMPRKQKPKRITPCHCAVLAGL